MISINNLFKLVVLVLVLSGCASRPVVYRAPPQAYQQAPVTPVYTLVAPRVQPSVSIVNQPTFDKPILQVAITVGYLEGTLTHITISNRSIAYGKKIQCESLSLCTVNLLDDLQYRSVSQHTSMIFDVALVERVTALKSFPIHISTEQFMRPALNMRKGEQIYKTPDELQPSNLYEDEGLYEIIATRGRYVQICTSTGISGWVKASAGQKVFAAKKLLDVGLIAVNFTSTARDSRCPQPTQSKRP